MEQVKINDMLMLCSWFA